MIISSLGAGGGLCPWELEKGGTVSLCAIFLAALSVSYCPFSAQLAHPVFRQVFLRVLLLYLFFSFFLHFVVVPKNTECYRDVNLILFLHCVVPDMISGGRGGSIGRASASRSNGFHDQRFESRPEHKKKL